MMKTIRSEWIKLSTTVTPKVLGIIAIAFPFVISVLSMSLSDPDYMQLFEVTSLVVGPMALSNMLLGSLAAIAVTAEYGHNTIRPTYAATSSRVRVQLSKLFVSLVTVGVIASIAAFGSWFVARAIGQQRTGATLSLTDKGFSSSSPLEMLVAAVALAMIVAVFASGFGLILRSSAGSIVMFLLWILVAEGIIALVFARLKMPDVAAWMPYSAAFNATNGLSGLLGDPSKVQTLPYSHLWFLAFSSMVYAVGLLLNNRRDA